MLEVKDLSVCYSQEKQVLNSINLRMDDGQIIGLVGESGSGKSTIIRAIIGLLPGNGKITAGSIKLDGREMTRLTDKEWLKIRGREISMIFQDSGVMLNPIRRVGAQFVEYIRIHEKISKKDAWDRAADMLGRMRLPDPGNVMRSYPFQLSGGMRQRVGIALGMAFSPKLLLADEATSALDATTQAQIIRQLMELRDVHGTSIIMVTHNLGVAAYMSDYLVVLKDGNIVDQGEREKILHNPSHEYTKRMIAAVPQLRGEVYV